MSKTLADLKVGDEVTLVIRVRHSPETFHIASVQKVTPKRIAVSGEVFDRETGRSTERYSHRKITPVTSDHRKAHAAALEERDKREQEAKKEAEAREARRRKWLADQVEKIAFEWLHGKGPEAAAELLRQACEAWEHLE